MMNLAANLKEAYEVSTPENNSFGKAVKAVDWDSIWTSEDGDTYYEAAEFTLVVFSLNPFEKVHCKPCVMHADGSQYYFN